MKVQYFKSLDGLRCYAVLLVLLFHARILALGWIGVHIFFVLSGFLITSILTSSVSSPTYYKAFYARRFLRIFPIYYSVLFAVVLFSLFKTTGIPNKWIYALYLQNYPLGLSNFHNFSPRLLDHTWSLAVEEQFYLVFPLIVRTFYNHLKYIIPFFIVVGMGFLFLLPLRFPNNDINWTNTCTNFIFLGAGAFLAIVQKRKKFTFIMLVPAAICACVLGFLVYPIQLTNRSGEIFLVAIAPLILLLISYLVSFESLIKRIVFENPVVLYIGRISYGVYLYHYPIFVMGDRYGIGWPYKFLATFVLAALSWHFFESKILSFKRFFPYEPADEQFVPQKAIGVPQ